MNEIDILKLFYDEMTNLGVTLDQVFLSIEEDAAAMLSKKLKQPAPLETVQSAPRKCTTASS
ncbi:MAG: hypothetical protein ACRCXC_02405 [Legionella sp.]